MLLYTQSALRNSNYYDQNVYSFNKLCALFLVFNSITIFYCIYFYMHGCLTCVYVCAAYMYVVLGLTRRRKHCIFLVWELQWAVNSLAGAGLMEKVDSVHNPWTISQNSPLKFRWHSLLVLSRSNWHNLLKERQ